MRPFAEDDDGHERQQSSDAYYEKRYGKYLDKSYLENLKLDASPRGHRHRPHLRQGARYKFESRDDSSGSRQNPARFKFEESNTSQARQNAARFNSPRAHRARVKRRQKVGFVGIDDSEQNSDYRSEKYYRSDYRSHALDPLDPFSRSVEHKFTDFDHKSYDFGDKVNEFGHKVNDRKFNDFDQRIGAFSPGILRTDSEEDSRCTFGAHVHI